MKLRIWWIPQVPGNPFYVDVESVKDGVNIMKVLADYDQFQFNENIKSDYSNSGGLEMLEDGEWCSWIDEETGIDDPDEYLESVK